MGRELKVTENNMDEVFQAINESMEKGLRHLCCKCSCCGAEGIYLMDKLESKTLERYWCYGRQLGYIQDLFPNVPAWIRSGAIDKYSDGFCVCPKCCESGDDEEE